MHRSRTCVLIGICAVMIVPGAAPPDAALAAPGGDDPPFRWEVVNTGTEAILTGLDAVGAVLEGEGFTLAERRPIQWATVTIWER